LILRERDFALLRPSRASGSTGADSTHARGHRQAIEAAPALARQTAELIKAAPQLELIREPDLGIVLFRRVGWKPEDYDVWAQRLHQDQVAFIPPTKWEGETVGRFAFLHPDTNLEVVREVLARTE
jgi:aromatic-L-amino-acid/L-tryptophan decarboxylase